MDLSPSVDDGEKVERKGKGKKNSVYSISVSSGDFGVYMHFLRSVL